MHESIAAVAAALAFAETEEDDERLSRLVDEAVEATGMTELDVVEEALAAAGGFPL